MRHVAATVFVIASLAACADSVVVDRPVPFASAMVSTPTSSDLSDVRVALSAFKGGGFSHEPVLTMTKVCYSMCSRTLALPEFAVYPDGSLVAMDREPPGGAEAPYRIRWFDLSQTDLDQMADLFHLGGLTTGDVHAAGTRAGVADGGGIIFETVIGSTRTYVHAPFLDSADADPTRDALFRLRTLFRSYSDTAVGIVLSMRWTMVGEAHTDPSGRPQTDPTSHPWPRAGQPSGNPPCLDFDPAGLPPEFERLSRHEEYESISISFGGTSYGMTTRLLLPHENGCADVQTRLNRILTNDHTLDLGGEG